MFTQQWKQLSLPLPLRTTTAEPCGRRKAPSFSRLTVLRRFSPLGVAYTTPWVRPIRFHKILEYLSGSQTGIWRRFQGTGVWKPPRIGPGRDIGIVRANYSAVPLPRASHYQKQTSNVCMAARRQCLCRKR